MFRVIIAGGRNFQDYELLKQSMDHFLSQVKTREEIQIISGGARGADALGERYAQERGYLLRVFPADWDRYGRGAGLIRNEEMGKNADALVAFWDGKSKGTEHMIGVASLFGLKIRIKRYDGATLY